ncbi:MAG: NPCBM/NEW2 domain-containing protein [Acidobacteria bacterium]|nr:NPCBM/NEW2 domain-containing protein [Acidobacteriota bacterium]
MRRREFLKCGGSMLASLTAGKAGVIRVPDDVPRPSGATAGTSHNSRVVLMIGEDEYETDETLLRFATGELERRGIRCTLVLADPKDKNSFPGLEALNGADLLVLSVRRRTPPKAQLDLIRSYLEAHRPLVAIRTSSHAFVSESRSPHSDWKRFDADVLGGTYVGYDGGARETGSEAWSVAQAAGHPILKGLEKARFYTPSWIYRMRSLAPTTTVLVKGRWSHDRPTEPVAWTNSYKGGRIFYTSLGHPGDFELTEFRLLLLNGIFWAMDKPAPGALLVPPRTKLLELDAQTREAGKGQPLVTRQVLDPTKTGIVVIDMWNYHHCMTAAQRVGALVPRMNRVLEAARRLKMTVMWAPTDVASQYAGTPQRERAMVVPILEVPVGRPLACAFTVKKKDCMCGPGIACFRNFGWDSMHPDLRIGPSDRIVFGMAELYSNARHLGLTHLIYMGVHTNACVVDRPEGARNMAAAGLSCILARDVTDALTYYDPETGFTPDRGTAEVIADIERAGIPTIDMAAEMRKAGLWQSDSITAVVHITPWGTKLFPYFFSDSVTATLTAPTLEDVEIRYTLDGAEPGSDSAACAGPLKLTESTQLRAAAFRQGRRVSLISDGDFVRLGPVPPSAAVYLDQLKPIAPERPALAWGLTWEPKISKAFSGGALRIRNRTYVKGIGMRAPANLMYRLQPDYDRFVALAGIDDELYRQRDRARFLSIHCSVRFQVYIDGELASESPVMRLSQEPWRFDVSIPEGSRQMNLVVSDAGSRSALDLADWVEAGFMLKK